MKTIAVICAMEKEIAYIKEHFSAELVDERFRIYDADVGGNRLIATVSGIGKVNSAVSTQRIIDRYSPDAVINVGVAGGLDRSLDVLDMVIAKEAVYHDFFPVSLLEEEENLKTSIFCSDEHLVSLAKDACIEMRAEGRLKNFVTGRVCSGDCFVEDDAVSRRLREELHGSCVEMEGAPIAQTCLLNNIPFLVIRSISDFADNNAEMSYDSFSSLAATQGGEVLAKIIKAL